LPHALILPILAAAKFFPLLERLAGQFRVRHKKFIPKIP
jgi:hypothetical protein